MQHDAKLATLTQDLIFALTPCCSQPPASLAGTHPEGLADILWSSWRFDGKYPTQQLLPSYSGPSSCTWVSAEVFLCGGASSRCLRIPVNICDHHFGTIS